MRGGREIADADIAYARTKHIGGVEREDGNLVALHFELQRVLDARTHHLQVGNGATRTAQTAHNLLAAHLHAGNRCVVHAHDTVAGHDAHSLGRASRHGLNDHERVLNHVELHANAVKRTRQRFGHLFGLLRCGVGRVRIQLLQHAADGIFHQFLLVHAVHIEVGHCHLGYR